MRAKPTIIKVDTRSKREESYASGNGLISRRCERLSLFNSLRIDGFTCEFVTSSLRFVRATSGRARAQDCALLPPITIPRGLIYVALLALARLAAGFNSFAALFPAARWIPNI